MHEAVSQGTVATLLRLSCIQIRCRERAVPPQIRSMLLIRQENIDTILPPIPQRTRGWMGHPSSIQLPDQ
jgi:hypothetical protein